MKVCNKCGTVYNPVYTRMSSIDSHLERPKARCPFCHSWDTDNAESKENKK